MTHCGQSADFKTQEYQLTVRWSFVLFSVAASAYLIQNAHLEIHVHIMHVHTEINAAVYDVNRNIVHRQTAILAAIGLGTLA